MTTATRLHNRLFVIALLVFVLYLLLSFGVYAGLTSHVLGGNDFFSRWEGARALLLRGDNPYADAVTREIQIAMIGRLALPGEDQLAFAYPLFVIFPIAPLATLPYALAQAFWMALLILAVVGGSLALAHLYRVPTRPFVLVILSTGVLIFYPSVRGIFNGQIALMSFFFIATALWAVSAQADVAVGVLLALATVKPQPAILLVPLIIIWAWRRGRRRIIGAALGTFGALVIVSMFLVPSWPLDFLQGLREYAQYEPVGPPVQILADFIFPGGLSLVFTLLVSLGLLGWLVWSAAGSLDNSWDDFQPTIGLAAVVSTLIAGRMGTPDQVLLLIPWLQWLSALLRRGENGWAVLAVCMMVIVPWSVFLATLRGNAENPGVALVLAFLSLAICIWQAGRSHRLMPEHAR